MNTPEKDTLKQEKEFQEEKFYFSFSSLVKLLTDPRVFYRDYILKEREELSAKYLDIGELVHCFVLEPENFEDKFVLMSKKVPGGKLKEVIDDVYNKSFPSTDVPLDDLSMRDLIISTLKECDLYQGLVDSKKEVNGVKPTGDDKRLEKAVTPETIEYFNVLREGETKTIVDINTSIIAKEKADAILNNKTAMSLLEIAEEDQDLHIEIHKEIELKAELDSYAFGLKGIIDCVKVDYENDTIHIIDIKTTSKTLNDWTKGFGTSPYKYWLQPIVYKELLLSLIRRNDRKEWKMKVHYVVIDKDNQVYCYPVSTESLRIWEKEAKESYDIAKWHLENNNFELPYNYANNFVEL